MPFYTGRTADGSDAIETGAYLSPDGKEWSNMPYTDEQHKHEKSVRVHWRIFDHINSKRTLRDEYHLILAKKSTLPRLCRDYVINCFIE